MIIQFFSHETFCLRALSFFPTSKAILNWILHQEKAFYVVKAAHTHTHTLSLSIACSLSFLAALPHSLSLSHFLSLSIVCSLTFSAALLHSLSLSLSRKYCDTHFLALTLYRLLSVILCSSPTLSSYLSLSHKTVTHTFSLSLHVQNTTF